MSINPSPKCRPNPAAARVSLATGSMQIRTLGESDLEYVDHMVHDAGWNQLSADWRRLLTYEPEGCFAAIVEGRLVGTVTTTSYGSDLAWIGMMLVHPRHRRRGIATALMQHCLHRLHQRNVECIMLDATPAGQQVYRRLGFQPRWSFHRWERSRPGPQGMLPAESNTFQYNGIDHAAFGTDRSKWLDLLGRDSLTVAMEGGFGMARAGRQAAYLGPVVAQTREGAERMIRDLLDRLEGPIIWDVPGPSVIAQEMAESLGFQQVRPLTRMAWGQMRRKPDLRLQYALAAPETG